MAILDIWKKVVQTPTFVPDHFQLPSSQVDIGEKINVPLEAHRHYFIVRVNELFLSYGRKWFSTYDPVVFVTTEFLYDTKKITMPFLVSPTMLQSPFKKLPQGMLYKDTTVAGLHPYRGGTFGLNMILGRLRQENYLRKLLGFMEHAAGSFTVGLGSIITNYSQIANMVLDGMDDLLEDNDIKPIIGFRQEFVPVLQDNFTTGYFVLLNSNGNNFDKSKFYVQNNSLFYGENFGNSIPFRTDDYVLYSIRSATKRDDIEMLPFHKEFIDLQKHVESYQEISKKDKIKISGKLFSLHDSLRNSPDLIRPQVEDQYHKYKKEISDMVDARQPLSGEFVKKDVIIDQWEQKMDEEAVEILNLNF